MRFWSGISFTTGKRCRYGFLFRCEKKKSSMRLPFYVLFDIRHMISVCTGMATVSIRDLLFRTFRSYNVLTSNFADKLQHSHLLSAKVSFYLENLSCNPKFNGSLYMPALYSGTKLGKKSNCPLNSKMQWEPWTV